MKSRTGSHAQKEPLTAAGTGGSGTTRRAFVKGAAAVSAGIALGGGGYIAANWAPDEKAELLRTTMGDGMSNVLVLYGTGTGCTAGVAEQIGATLSEAGATVKIAPAEDKPDPAGFDAFVVGSGVRVGQWHGKVKEWVIANSGALKERPTAFFTCCLTAATDADDAEKMEQVRAYTDPLIEESGVTPVGLGLFAGWHEPKSFSLPERLVLKVMKAPVGDFRDFDSVADWTRGITDKLGVA